MVWPLTKGAPVPKGASVTVVDAPACPPLEDERPPQRTGTFTFAGNRLAYTEFGRGELLVVLLHGPLMTRTMHAPLARDLASCGYRVITLDLLGHGESDRPTQYWRYSTTAWAEQVIALLDHLDVRTAVVGGTSLGANVGLQVAAIAPERLHGIVAELPVLDNTAIAGAIAFTPLLLAARFTPWLVDATAWVANRVPRGSHWIDMLTETLRQRPRAMTATMLGVLFGPVAPPKSVRRRITLPALVLGRRHDPVHPFGDAGTLAVELPNAQFVEAGNPFELRVRPERLTEVIIEFLGRTFAAGANRSPVDRGNP